MNKLSSSTAKISEQKYTLNRSVKYSKKLLLKSKNRIGGFLFRVVVYALLTSIGFIYLYPLLFMILTSFMNVTDLISPIVRWLPTSLFLGNFRIAHQVLDTWEALVTTSLIAGFSALFQTLSCAMVGYGFARHEFPIKKFWMALVIVSYVIPVQVTMIPRYMLFDSYDMINTVMPFLLPAISAQGIKSTIFVMLFYQFFRSYPKILDEAAQIDGAGRIRVFVGIAIPMSIPAIVVGILFSFVWYWNETYMAGIFFGREIQTLPMRLQSFVASFNRLFPTADGSVTNRLNEGIRMAGTVISIIPLLLLYVLLQKQFVESVDRTGITGE